MSAENIKEYSSKKDLIAQRNRFLSVFEFLSGETFLPVHSVDKLSKAKKTLKHTVSTLFASCIENEIVQEEFYQRLLKAIDAFLKYISQFRFLDQKEFELYSGAITALAKSVKNTDQGSTIEESIPIAKTPIDTELMKKGDTKMWNRFILKYKLQFIYFSKRYSFFYQLILGDGHIDPEDIFQRAMELAHRDISHFKENNEVSLKCWCLAIIKNTAKMQFREACSRSGIGRRGDSWRERIDQAKACWPLTLDDIDADDEVLADMQLSPEGDFLVSERRHLTSALIRSSINVLTDKQKAIIEIDLEDTALDDKEIGKKIGIPTDTVRSRRFYAINDLREMMSREYQGIIL